MACCHSMSAHDQSRFEIIRVHPVHVCRRAALHQLAQNCDILFNSAVKARELDEHLAQQAKARGVPKPKHSA